MEYALVDDKDLASPVSPSKRLIDKDDESLKKLKRATIFVFCFFIVEVVGGIWAGSLSVITDAAHLLTDVSVSISNRIVIVIIWLLLLFNPWCLNPF